LYDSYIFADDRQNPEELAMAKLLYDSVLQSDQFSVDQKKTLYYKSLGFSNEEVMKKTKANCVRTTKQRSELAIAKLRKMMEVS